MRLNIYARSVIYSLIPSFTVIFILVLIIIPLEKNSLKNSLAAQAKSLSASIAEVCGNAFIAGDYSFMVDHSMQVIKSSPDILYIIISRSGGSSLIHTSSNWQQLEARDPLWETANKKIPSGDIRFSKIAGAAVFHYAFPLQFSGIEWGFLYIGLSLEHYNKTLLSTYRWVLLLSFLCFALATFIALYFARQLVSPIMTLHNVAERIRTGDLNARAKLRTGNEIEELANTFNRMTDALLESQAEIMATRDYVENIIKSMNECLIVLDNNLIIKTVNNATLKMLGYNASGIIGKRVNLLFPPDIMTDEDEFQSTHNSEKAFLSASGRIIPVLFSSSVMKDSEGRNQGVVCIASDITEQKQIEKALIASKKEAIAANIAKSDFLANMSHEIRTPMHGVLGVIDLLLATDLTDDQRSLMNILQYSGKSLMNIINNILDFSKIESGQMFLEHIPFDVRKLLQEVISIIQERACAKNISVNLVLEKEVPLFFVTDPLRLQQVLNNLLDNAVKFTNKGEVNVQVSLKNQQGDNPLILFEVSDTGIGINEREKERIFDYFSQADSSTTRKFGGSGLGLSIAKRIVTMMGGDIGVDSVPGKGSHFWFTIKTETLERMPYETGEPATSDEEAFIPGNILQNTLVLVAEDNPVNQGLAKLMLESAGCTVEVADNGVQAVRAFSENTFDVILMDCHMPEMDGYNAAMRIREIEKSKGQTAGHIPIIALTGDVLKSSLDKCTSFGMDDYISKPFRQHKLINTLKKWLLPEDKKQTAKSMFRDNLQHKHNPACRHINRKSLDIIRALQKEDMPNVLECVIDQFASSSPTLLETMEKAVEAGDSIALWKAAHSLKTSAANLGAVRLSALCREIELSGRNNAPDRAKEMLGEITFEYNAVIKELAAIKQGVLA